MYIAIVAVIVLIFFTIWLTSYFFIDILEFIINLVILWAVCVRGYVEIEREQKQNYYLAGLLITTAVFLAVNVNFFSKIFHIWAPVLFLVTAFLLAQLSFVSHSFYIRKCKK